MNATRLGIGSLFLIATMISACSSHSGNDGQVHALTIHDVVKNSPWVTEYSDAMIAPKSSCATLRRLSLDPTAPIMSLARVRFIQHCVTSGLVASITELDGFYDNPGTVWLKPIVSEVIIELAIRANHKSTLAKYALVRSKDLSSQREKEQLLRRGIDAARALNQTTQAQALETELFRISPRLISQPKSTDWLRMGDDFRVNEEWNEAVRYYNKIVNSSSFTVFDGFKARNGIREVHKAKFRFYGGALATFLSASRDVASYCERQVQANSGVTADQRRQLFEAWMQYARDVWSYGDVEVAKREVTRTLGLSWLDPVFRGYTLWLQSRIFANYSEWTKSAASGVAATDALRNELGNSATWTDWHWTLWDDSHWMAALAQRKKNQPLRSAELLEQALVRTKNPNTEIKFLFWAAQGEHDAGQISTANSNWQRLAALDPHGFYGFMAHYKLGIPLQPLRPSDLSNVTRPSTMTQADFDILMWLTYCEELTLAQKYAKVTMSATSVALEDLMMRAFIHDFITLNTLLFSRIDAKLRNQFITDHASLFYPQPYLDIVQGSVARFPRIDAEYVYSVMRQESAFNPAARSWANAYGLIQLLPSVAREVQAKAGVYFTEDYELFRPAINVPLGVAHMDNLIGVTGDSFILRTSGYNAKAEKALEWKERLYNGNVHEFLEEIPYDETRSYIRLVMRNYIMNKRLTASQAFLFPPHLLAL